MPRITVSVPESLRRAAVKKAATERRSISSYLATLIENDIDQSRVEKRVIAEARRLGLDPVEILTTAAEQKLTSEATA